MKLSATTVAFLLAKLASGTGSCNYAIGAAVKTTSGIVQGHPAPNASSVSEYLGIPFAQPPVGNLRFAPPVAYTSSNPIDGSKFGHDCPVLITEVPTFLPPNVYNILSDLAQNGDDPQEDCLNINVWSKPQVGEEKKAVLVWIYGGGFTIGGTNTSAYSGQFWADTEDVVIVNFNYRLNIFGFPGSDAATQNLGLLDQRLAIEWVRDNIAGFGGDPERITIFGQSAGSASVDLYNYAWTEDPIIAGSILQSGTSNAFGNRFPDKQVANWYKTTEQLGCGTNATSTPEAVLSCMRQPNISTTAILNAQNPGSGANSILGNFGPTIDGKTVFANYTDRALKKQLIQKPAIVGNNDYEAGLFILIEAGSVQATQQQWDGLDLGVFTCPASTAAYLRTLAGIPVYRYRYFGMFPNLQLPTSVGRAYHGSEILPMFGSSEEITQEDSTWQERATGSYLRGAWSQFAKCPSGGLPGYNWPMYDPTKDTLQLIGQNNNTMPTTGSPSFWDTGCPPIYNGNPPM